MLQVEFALKVFFIYSRLSDYYKITNTTVTVPNTHYVMIDL